MLIVCWLVDPTACYKFTPHRITWMGARSSSGHLTSKTPLLLRTAMPKIALTVPARGLRQAPAANSCRDRIISALATTVSLPSFKLLFLFLFFPRDKTPPSLPRAKSPRAGRLEFQHVHGCWHRGGGVFFVLAPWFLPSTPYEGGGDLWVLCGCRVTCWSPLGCDDIHNLSSREHFPWCYSR